MTPADTVGMGVALALRVPASNAAAIIPKAQAKFAAARAVAQQPAPVGDGVDKSPVPTIPTNLTPSAPSPTLRADAHRAQAAALLRKPSGNLPAGPGPLSLITFRAPGAYASALDGYWGAIDSMNEGYLRSKAGGAGGGRQMWSGIVQVPFMVPAVGLGWVDTSMSNVMSSLNGVRERSRGVAKFFLTMLQGLCYLAFAPLRLVSLVLGAFVVRPLAFIGAKLGQWIGGAEAQRSVYNTIPAKLADPSQSEYSNERGPRRAELADPETWIRYYAANGASLYDAPPEIVSDFMELRATDRKAYDQLRAKLADADIQCFFRFHSLKLLRDTLKNRNPDPKDVRPVALIVAGPSDHNGAFLTLGTTIEQLSKGYRVVYVEANNDVELAQAIDKYGAQKPLDALVIAGHGAPSLTNLSDLDPSNVWDASLDIHDTEKLRPLKDRLAKNATVVLESCETGQDDPNQTSMIEMLHEVWPHVYLNAPEIASRGAGYTLDRYNHIDHASELDGKMRRLDPVL